jgi:hypothetical protein
MSMSLSWIGTLADKYLYVYLDSEIGRGVDVVLSSLCSS